MVDKDQIASELDYLLDLREKLLLTGASTTEIDSQMDRLRAALDEIEAKEADTIEARYRRSQQ